MGTREGILLYAWVHLTATIYLPARRNLQGFRGAAARSEDEGNRGFRRASGDDGDTHSSTLATPRRSNPSWDIPLQTYTPGRGPSSTTASLRPSELHGGAA